MAETMRAAFGRVASALLDEDARVAVVLAEISTEYFAHASARHPARVVNVGIMEQTMVGVAAGFAMEGFHPIAHSLSPFMAERPYEQLKLDIGYQGLGGTFVGVGGSYDYGSEGATHHAPADASLMLGIPGMEVVVPGHADEVEHILRSCVANGLPTYLRLSVTANEDAHDAEPGAPGCPPPWSPPRRSSPSGRCSIGRSPRVPDSTSRSHTRRASGRSITQGCSRSAAISRRS